MGEAAPSPRDPSTSSPGLPCRPPPSPAAPEHPQPQSGAIRGEHVHEFLLLEIKFRVGSVLGKGVFL